MKAKVLTSLFFFIPLLLLSQTVSVSSIDANGPNTGSIMATIVDPLEDFAPYEIIWTNSNGEIASCFFTETDIINGEVSCEATNLNPGTYCLEATAFICDQEEAAQINKCFTVSGSNCTNMLAGYFPFEIQEAICSSETIDQVVMIFSDVGECARNSIGEPSVNFEWSNGQTTAYPAELHPGEYCVTITPTEDVAPACSSCFFVSCIEIPRLDEPIIINASTNNICIATVTYVGLQINYRVYGWINVAPTGGFGPFEIAWLDGDNSGAFRKVNSPGTYCAQIRDNCNNINYECWDIIEEFSDAHCPVPYFPKNDDARLEETVNEITANWGTFNAKMDVEDDWELRLENSSYDFVKYNLLQKGESEESGKIHIISQNENFEAEVKDKTTESNAIPLDQKTNIKVFPNPASNIVNVRIIAENSEPDVLQIFNISGKLMFERAIELVLGENNYSIGVKDIPSGVYFLKTEFSTPTKLIITKN